MDSLVRLQAWYAGFYSTCEKKRQRREKSQRVYASGIETARGCSDIAFRWRHREYAVCEIIWVRAAVQERQRADAITCSSSD